MRGTRTARLPEGGADFRALHFFGRDREIGFAEALSWLQAAAERGHPLAQLN
jgi:TPR repeat protein